MMGLQTVMNGRPTEPETDKILDWVRGHKEGDVLTHQQLETMLRLGRMESRYRTILTAAKRRVLRLLGIWLKAVPGVGYEYLPGGKQVAENTAYQKRGVRQFAQGLKIAASVTDERLPDQKHRLARDHMVDQMKYLVALAKTHRKEAELIVGTPDSATSMALPKGG